MRKLLLLPLLTAALLLAAGAAPAAGAEAKAPVQVTLTTRTQNDGAVLLEAQLTRPDGSVIGNQEIDFYVRANFFMSGQVHVSSDITDSTGRARTLYRPTWNGQTEFSASFRGDSALAPAAAQAALAIRSLQADYRAAPRDLPGLRQTAGRAAIMAAVAVWVLLAMVFLRVLWVVKRPEPVELPQAATSPASTGSR